jgi:hypothetical protein
MHTDAIHVTTQEVYAELQRELGERLVVRLEPDASRVLIAYCHPGTEHAVLISLNESQNGTILVIDAPVSVVADWSSSGLAELLLREQGGWLFGRNERWGEGLVIEHCLAAETPPDHLAEIVIALADTAIRLERDLGRMGAVTGNVA